jgi:ABC-type Fe3+/spermidine/putrescine transport system ATPase subunit
MLYVNELYKTFADDNSTVNALQDINMHIKPNEFAVIVGPSGCGKTTLLNIAAGLETATRGNITLNGNAITGPGPDRGMVFQSYTLFPWLTVEENVAFGPRQQRLNPPEYRSKHGVGDNHRIFSHYTAGGRRPPLQSSRGSHRCKYVGASFAHPPGLSTNTGAGPNWRSKTAPTILAG